MEQSNIKRCLHYKTTKRVYATINDENKVSFVPMECIGIDKKYFNTSETRELKDVYKGFVYFKDGDVLLAKITPSLENGKLGIAKNLYNGVGFGSTELITFKAWK